MRAPGMTTLRQPAYAAHRRGACGAVPLQSLGAIPERGAAALCPGAAARGRKVRSFPKVQARSDRPAWLDVANEGETIWHDESIALCQVGRGWFVKTTLLSGNGKGLRSSFDGRSERGSYPAAQKPSPAYVVALIVVVSAMPYVTRISDDRLQGVEASRGGVFAASTCITSGRTALPVSPVTASLGKMLLGTFRRGSGPQSYGVAGEIGEVKCQGETRVGSGRGALGRSRPWPLRSASPRQARRRWSRWRRA